MFLVLYIGSDDVELVPPKVCSKYCPNLVIEFYENRQIGLIEEEEFTSAIGGGVTQVVGGSTTNVAMDVGGVITI